MAAHFIYPGDWRRLDARPSFYLKLDNPRRLVQPRLCRFRKDDTLEELVVPMNVEPSPCGTLVRVSSGVMLENGKYVLNVSDETTLRTIGATGFVVDPLGVSCDATAEEMAAFCTHVEDTRILVNGAGKCGSTWLYRLLGTLPGFHTHKMDGLTGRDLPDLENVAPRGVFHGHYRMTHELWSMLHDKGFSAVNIVRDPRDVIVSEYFHLFHMQRGTHHPHLLHLDKDAMLSYSRIQQWSYTYHYMFDALNWSRCEQVLTVRYEDLLNRQQDTMRAVMHHLRLPYVPSIMDSVIGFNAFRYETGGRDRGSEDACSPNRKGIVGDHRNHMTPETADLLSRRFAAIFQEFGY